MVSRLGRVDSHGCIRLAPANARVLFEMVARQRGATRIVIEGASPPRAAPALVARRGGQARVATVTPARTAQMGLPAQAGRQIAAAPSRAGGERAAARTTPARVAARAGSARTTVAAPRDDNRYFTEWFLRR